METVRSFSKKNTLYPPHPCAQPPLARQCGRSPPQGRTPCRRSLLGQRHSHHPCPRRSLSGRPDNHHRKQAWKGWSVRHQQMPHCTQSPMTTCYCARKCPPSVGHLAISRRRRPLHKGRGCKHPHPLVQPTTRPDYLMTSDPKSRPIEASSRPPTSPLPSEADARSERARWRRTQQAVVLEGGNIIRS